MSQFRDYANSVAMREAGLRDRAEGLANMSSTLTDVAASTGAPAAINPAEIPSISGLASMRAGVSDLSSTRQTQQNRQIKNLPKYVSAYRNYLQWRYPTRYGRGSGGGVPASNPYGQYDVPALPGITGRPTIQ